MNWVQRKIYLYNVTFGLYMLDWWERFLFNSLVLVLMWFIFYNGSRNLTQFYKREWVIGNREDLVKDIIAREDLVKDIIAEIRPEN